MLYQVRNPALSLLAALILAACAGVIASADEEDFGPRLPRVPAVEPRDAEKSFHVAGGYQIHLAAAEPLLASPVALDFDAAGRLYVVEMRDYSEQAVEKLGRVRRLEDRDGDGRFEHATIFAEGLSWPTAVICYDDGVFVAAAPDIWFLKDTDFDGQADAKRRVITGFGRSNVQGLVNSLRWTLDGRIHGSTSSAGGELEIVTVPETATTAKRPPLIARGRDFSFNPRGLTAGAEHFNLRLESGGGQHGMSFDDWGRKFVCSNSNHIQQVMFEDRIVARNPLVAAPSPLVDIALDGPAAEVFRKSPVEPWRALRTELRVAGKVPGPIEGGGRAAGYFTSATGVTIYRGDVWPSADRGLAIVGDVGSNLIHRKRLQPNGSELRAKRIDENSEFVASTDIWFRPVQFANGPDGCLYVADMCREVIEHPASLPPVIKRHLDLTSGRDRGRIYRIAPAGFSPLAPPRLDKLTTPELVATLAHPNGWRRDTAARLLIERHDPKSHEPLSAALLLGQSAVARMHALHVLGALDQLEREHVLRGLSDEHPRVREHAVRLADKLLPMPREEIAALIDDADPEVRRQVAIAIGHFTRPMEKPRADASDQWLARLAKRDINDRWMRLAVLSSATGRAGNIAVELLQDGVHVGRSAREFVGQLATLCGREGQREQIQNLAQQIETLAARDDEAAQELSVALVQGLASGGKAMAGLLPPDGIIGKLVAQRVKSSLAIAADESKRVAARVSAVGTLGLAPFTDVEGILAGLLAPQTPQELQLAAIRSLGLRSDDSAATTIIAAWPTLGPAARSEAVEALFGREERVHVALDAIAGGLLPAAAIDQARGATLARHPDARVRELAKKAIATNRAPTDGERAKITTAYRQALTTKTDAERGAAHFRKHCATCHRIGDAGHAVGPDLAAIRNRGAEAILLAVLEPNREVNPQYVNYSLRTTDGRAITGIIASETATSVTLRRGDGISETLLRSEIDELQTTGVSLMPEGWEKQLSAQDVADLVAFLLK